MIRSTRSLGVATAIIAGIIIATACGGSDGSEFDGSSGGASNSSGDPGSSGQLPGSGADGGDELKGCATDRKTATPLPLDLFIMLDSSGSMAALVAPNKSKYVAVTDALKGFLADGASAGIGVGLQFFPLPAAGVPAACSASAPCPGATGPCTAKFCASNGGGPKSTGLTFCETDQQCPPGPPGTCIPAGRCSIQTNVYCPGTISCGNDPVTGFAWGTCQPSTTGYCEKGDSCAAADYAKPAVDIAPLPGSAAALTSALTAKSPQGKTPTSAALQGAIDRAIAQATANPSHTVAVVFATDGLPEGCDTNIDNIANIAQAGAAKVKTFVIGVFRDDEKVAAQANLDKIAIKGGTGKAFIITASASTTQDFQNALATIRGNALPCDYNVPVPTTGEVPDFGKLNIQQTDPSGAKSLYSYTTTAAACDPVKGGWYYDVDPVTGGKPTKIILCPATCTQAKATGGSVDVVLGCKTQGPK